MKNNISLLRTKNPLILLITNDVTVNDCANILLSLGASPIVSASAKDASTLAERADAVCINMGTLSPLWEKAALAAAKKAHSLDIPVVFDPCGAAASDFRLRKAKKLIKKIKPQIIKGNHSEIAALFCGILSAKGVDAGSAPENAREYAGGLASISGAAVFSTGKTDIIAYNGEIKEIDGGSALSGILSGAGCMLSCIAAAFASFLPPGTACAYASLIMKNASSFAEKNCGGGFPLLFRQILIDNIANGDNEIEKI